MYMSLMQLKTTEARAVTIPNDRYGLQPDLLRTTLEKSSAGRRKVLPERANFIGSFGQRETDVVR